VTLSSRPEITARRNSSYFAFHTTMLATPVSSSSVMKITPFAVPGRCRTSTSPATTTRAPFGGRSSQPAGTARGGRGQSSGCGVTA
jgi:hypothetical protein